MNRSTAISLTCRHITIVVVSNAVVVVFVAAVIVVVGSVAAGQLYDDVVAGAGADAGRATVAAGIPAATPSRRLARFFAHQVDVLVVVFAAGPATPLAQVGRAQVLV